MNTVDVTSHMVIARALEDVAAYSANPDKETGGGVPPVSPFHAGQVRFVRIRRLR